MRNPDSNQALALAVISSKHDFVDALLYHRLHGANPNCVVDDNHVLGLALQVQDFSIARLLINRGAIPALMVHYSHNLAATMRGLQNESESNVKNVCDRLISQPGSSFVDAKDWMGRTMLHYAVTGGASYLARQLLTHGAIVDVQDNDGQTTMHLFLDEEPAGKRLDLFKLLLEYNARIDDTGFTVDRRDHLKWYLEKVAQERMQVSTSSATRSPIRDQSVPRLRDGDAGSGPPEASDDRRRGERGDTQTPADRIAAAEAAEDSSLNPKLPMLAITQENSTVVPQPAPVATKPDVDEWPSSNIEPNVLVSTELWFAATKAGHVFRVQMYLREGIDVNTTDEMSNTALHHAAAHGDVDLVPRLLQAGAEVDAKTALGNTPLHLAAAAGHLSAVKELIDAGADINAKNMARHTALFLALQHLLPATRSVAEYLLQLGASTRMTKSLDVLHALIGNRANSDPSPMMDRLAADMLTMLIDHDSGLQYTTDIFGRTALHTCVQTLQQAMAERLLARGAEVGAQDKDSMTPMQLLCAPLPSWNTRRAEMFRLLVQYGADYDPDILTADTEHVFGTLSSRMLGHPKIVVDRSQLTEVDSDLIERPALADPMHVANRQEAKDHDSSLQPTVSAIDMFTAVDDGDWYQLKRGIDAGGDPDAFSSTREPILHRAAQRQDIKVLQVLLNARANTNIRNEQGQTALHRAVLFDRPETAECLLNFGVEHSPIDKLGHTPLTLAASQHLPSAEIMDLLYCAGANIQTLLRQSRTILHIVLDKVNGPEPLSAVEWIVKTDKTLVNMATQRRRQTPLHMAVENGWLRCTEILVNFEARVNVMNAVGQTPMILLLQRSPTSDHTIFQLLSKKGGALSDTAIARLSEYCRANHDAYLTATAEASRSKHSEGGTVRGWWVCCSCVQTSGLALAPGHCPVCGHPKCVRCQTHSIPDEEMNSMPSGSFNSTDYDTSEVLAQMQEPPPRGIALRDRRWLSRLHLQCFHGEELTSWLLTAFNDLTDREDAVTLANALMERDAIVHVEGWHLFRDGKYLYTVTEPYRTPRANVATTADSEDADVIEGPDTDDSVKVRRSIADLEAAAERQERDAL
ncbi:vacuolar membrane-associated protein iml1 [Oleoguttula sp. CCFEE 5521]